jgi:CAP-Gly domain-containing linker protein 1
LENLVEAKVRDLQLEMNRYANSVVSKIYREDDLERELEKCKQKLAQAQKPNSFSRLSGESMLSSTSARPSSTYSVSTERSVQQDDPDVDDDTICEVCGQKGHDILSCQLVFSDAPKAQSQKTAEVWCEDCESRSHSTLDCPHSQDVF